MNQILTIKVIKRAKIIQTLQHENFNDKVQERI